MTKLSSLQMAEFVSRGFLRFDAVVPEALNEAFRDASSQNEIPAVDAGLPLDDAYPLGSLPRRLVDVPALRGAIESLVGPRCRFDHHFLHMAFPTPFFEKRGLRQSSQGTHQDSTIDPRRAFDIQLFYFPQETTREMGGTRVVPGSHLRIVSESATARYQNFRGQEHVVCPAGTVMIAHHGLWHGGGINRSEAVRYMFKIRLNPTVRQCRLWDTHDLPDPNASNPIFWVRDKREDDDVRSVLTRLEPWYEMDTGRLEIVNRIRLWRFLLGDEDADVDYWLTRLESAP